MGIEFEDANNVDPIDLMARQLQQVDELPTELRMQATILSLTGQIENLIGPMVAEIIQAQDSRPPNIPQARGEAMIYHKIMSVIFSALLVAAKRQSEVHALGCFNPKSRTVDSVPPVVQDDDPPDLVNMKTAELMKLLGMDNSEEGPH